jgi:short-subunit dehydrogenase
VPDDSEFLRSSNMRYSDYNKMKWNKEILDNLKNYLGIDVIINSSGVSSESYHNRMKNN